MKLLFINCCIRENDSRTLKNYKYFINKYKNKYNDITIKELKLYNEKIHPLLKDDIKRRELLIKNKLFNDSMFKYAKDFKEADKIIIAAPYWDLSFPSLLKVYFENICVTGLTFKYEDNKLVGLSKFKSLLYITTSGGPILDDDLLYINKISNFLGNGKIYFNKCMNLDVLGSNENKILENNIIELDKLVEEF